MRLLIHRLMAALLVLAFTTPARVVCGSASAADAAMAGMGCCKKLTASNTGSMERDCCRMNEGLPKQTPAAPLPPRATIHADTTLALTAFPASLAGDNNRAHHDLLSARGRPPTPSYFLQSALLI